MFSFFKSLFCDHNDERVEFSNLPGNSYATTWLYNHCKKCGRWEYFREGDYKANISGRWVSAPDPNINGVMEPKKRNRDVFNMM